MSAPHLAPDPIAQSIRQMLARRAAALRSGAALGITTITDAAGRPVMIVSPEARVAINTAILIDEIAADLSDLDGGRR